MLTINLVFGSIERQASRYNESQHPWQGEQSIQSLDASLPKDQMALAMTGRKSFLTPPADHPSRLLNPVAILEQIFNQPELGNSMPHLEQHESVRS